MIAITSAMISHSANRGGALYGAGPCVLRAACGAASDDGGAAGSIDADPIDCARSFVCGAATPVSVVARRRAVLSGAGSGAAGEGGAAAGCDGAAEPSENIDFCIGAASTERTTLCGCITGAGTGSSAAPKVGTANSPVAASKSTSDGASASSSAGGAMPPARVTEPEREGAGDLIAGGADAGGRAPPGIIGAGRAAAGRGGALCGAGM